MGFGYVGVTPMFEKAGFRRVVETAARSDGRPRILMRLDFDGGPGGAGPAGAAATSAAGL